MTSGLHHGRLFLGLLYVGLQGCGEAQDEPAKVPVEIAFEARMGGAPFSCEAIAHDFGSGKASIEPLDLRMFVHDVRLRDVSGAEVPVALEEDGVFQHDGLALLDFETGSGTCSGGTAETHTSLVGHVPESRTYDGVSFTIGVPQRMNHLAAATAPPPLNTPGMWWTWSTGYRYLRADVASEQNPEGYFFHLGGINCNGTRTTGLTCEYPSLVPITLEASDPTKVVLDFDKLFAGVDVNRVFDPDSGNLPGCLSSPRDDDCPPMFESLGLGFAGSPAPAEPQIVFRPEAD